MATATFNCPHCGAPLNYDGSDVTTIRCPFCNTTAVVPAELRPARHPKIQIIEVRDTAPSRTWIILPVLVILVVGVLFAVIGGAVTRGVNQTQGIDALPPVKESTAPVKPTITPQSTATPAYAISGLVFGEKGIGAGMLNNAQYLAIDGSQTIYVADYTGGRVQAFDTNGKYLRQWKAGAEKTNIHGMAANQKGEVYIAAGSDIAQYNGLTGELLGRLTNPNGGEFGDLFAAPDGTLAATWYEGRWGLITSLEGHRDDLVIFDARGEIARTIPSFISGQTDSLALDNFVAVDGLGNIFVLSDEMVFHFSPAGKFVNRFGSSGDQPGQFNSPGCITVDGQGRVLVGDFNVIHVLTPDGQLVADFPVKSRPDAMAFDARGGLWVLSQDRVTQYIFQQK